MSLQSIHDLEKEIHSDLNPSLFSNNHYADRIGGLSSTYSISDHFHEYAKVIQELNRKYNQFNLLSKIVSPVDAGFKPTDLINFIGSVSSPSVPDNILAENSDILIQENGFNLLLEQDV